MPRKLTKTVDVFLPMTRAGATAWLRKRLIPFTHMREMSGGGVAFRIRRGYYGDFRHQKDQSAPRYNKPKRARVSARGRTRRRNPVPRGRTLGDKSFTLSTLRAVKQGGRAEKIWYEDARDGKHYYHDFDGAQGAIMYLCESAAVGKCVLIVSGDLSTPLWEDA